MSIGLQKLKKKLYLKNGDEANYNKTEAMLRKAEKSWEKRLWQKIQWLVDLSTLLEEVKNASIKKLDLR